MLRPVATVPSSPVATVPSALSPCETAQPPAAPALASAPLRTASQTNRLTFCKIYVLVTFVTDQPPNDPDDAQPQLRPLVIERGEPEPVTTRAERLLSIVQKLIVFGFTLAHTLRQGLRPETRRIVTRHFGTIDIERILRRIMEGMILARSLEERLINNPGWPRDMTLDEVVRKRTQRSDEPPVEAAADDEAVAETDPADAAAAQARLPSARKIAKALRHRPAWSVLMEICRNVGLTPEHELWFEAVVAIIENGGDATPLFTDAMKRMQKPIGDPMSYVPVGWKPSPPPSTSPPATGPP